SRVAADRRQAFGGDRRRGVRRARETDRPAGAWLHFGSIGLRSEWRERGVRPILPGRGARARQGLRRRRRGSFAQRREKQLAGRAFNAAGAQNRTSAAKTHEEGPLTGDTGWTDRRAEPISLCVAIRYCSSMSSACKEPL